MMKGSERRLFPRRLLKTKIVFEDEFGEGLIVLHSEDISLGGIFVQSDIPIRLGSYVFLSFYLPDGKKLIRATGQIIRIAREESDKGLGVRKGMGVRFVGLSSEAREIIQEFVA